MKDKFSHKTPKTTNVIIVFYRDPTFPVNSMISPSFFQVFSKFLGNFFLLFLKCNFQVEKIEKDIDAEWSEAGIFFFFLKIISNCLLRPPSLGVRGEFLVATQFFQVSHHFSVVFIKYFKIPWYFQVSRYSLIFPGFPGRVGTLEHCLLLAGLCVTRDALVGWRRWPVVDFDGLVDETRRFVRVLFPL